MSMSGRLLASTRARVVPGGLRGPAARESAQPVSVWLTLSSSAHDLEAGAPPRPHSARDVAHVLEAGPLEDAGRDRRAVAAPADHRKRPTVARHLVQPRFEKPAVHVDRSVDVPPAPFAVPAHIEKVHRAAPFECGGELRSEEHTSELQSPC